MMYVATRNDVNDVYKRMCRCIHALMHAFIHSYVHTFIHTYSYVHSDICQFIHSYMHRQDRWMYGSIFRQIDSIRFDSIFQIRFYRLDRQVYPLTKCQRMQNAHQQQLRSSGRCCECSKIIDRKEKGLVTRERFVLLCKCVSGIASL